MRPWYCANSRSVQLDVTAVGRLLCTWVHAVIDFDEAFGVGQTTALWEDVCRR